MVPNLKFTGGQYFFISTLTKPPPPKKEKTKQKQLRPIRIKIWTAKNSWIRILMRRQGKSNLTTKLRER